jgi:hypothetical protein
MSLRIFAGAHRFIDVGRPHFVKNSHQVEQIVTAR